MAYIQGDAAGKVSILEEMVSIIVRRKDHMNMRLILIVTELIESPYQTPTNLCLWGSMLSEV